MMGKHYPMGYVVFFVVRDKGFTDGYWKTGKGGAKILYRKLSDAKKNIQQKTYRGKQILEYRIYFVDGWDDMQIVYRKTE